MGQNVDVLRVFSPPAEGRLGVQEMLANDMVFDAPFMASHLNSNMDSSTPFT